MTADALEWIGVRDGDRLLGWAWATDIDGHARVGDAPLNPFLAEVHPDTTLRETLDGIVNSRTNVAVVTGDDGRHLGMITVADISRGITPDRGSEPG
jgi:predicted transcriptional regulator